eukprot:jgi/Mesen1/1756/ME000014S01160
MALAAESMATIARILGAPHQEYKHTARQLRNVDLLDQMHKHAKSGRYYDFGNHTEHVGAPTLAWSHSP